MDKLIHGLWGCFFGVTVVIAIGSGVAYARSLRRIALNGFLSALASALYSAAFLGGLPVAEEQTQWAILGLITLLVSVLLAYLLFAILGFLQSPGLRQRIGVLLCVLLLAALLAGWLLPAKEFLISSTATACLLGLIALTAAVKKALGGDRLGWAVAFSICCMLVAVVSLGAIALDRQASTWRVYAVGAVAAILYMSTIAAAMWSRYYYLLELHKLMAYGPSYDPVTRMRTHQETGLMVGALFKSFRAKPQPLGVVALTIANLYALEQLYGAHAVNYAFFVCAGRLRRTVPGKVEMGRLGKEGFVLVMPNCSESAHLINLARDIQTHLCKPIAIKNSSELEAQGTIWEAEIGVGVLLVFSPESRGSDTVSKAYRMSRTAISYVSRIAWFDHSSGETIELPQMR